MKKNTIFLYVVCVISTILADDASMFHRYFWANYKHFSGNIPHAHDWYKKLFASHNSIYSYKGYLTFLASTHQFKQIVNLMPSLTKKFERDADVQLIFVLALQKTQQPQKADELIIALSQSFKNNADIALLAAQTYVQKHESENALLTIDAFLNNSARRPNNFIFYFLKSHIYVQLNQFSKALENIQKCLEMHPHFDKGWLLCASLYEKEGKIKEALSGYNTYLELSGGNAQIEKHLMTLMFKYKSIEDSKKNLLSHSISIDNALILFKQHRYPQALMHVNSCIEQDPKNNECKLLKIQILATMKNFTQAASTLTTWILQEPDQDMWPKILHLLAYNGMSHTHIIETFHAILAQQPNNLWCNLYCADMCMRNAQNDRALIYLEKALPCAQENSLGSKIAYQLALLQYENNNHELMHANLEKAHTLNPNCPHINNGLAYYWTTKGKNPTKAQSFIEKALALENTNPYFLDTQALIWYKEKKYVQAQEILENIAHHNNSTMLLHLAKVHYALNNKKSADIFTKKAETSIKNKREKKAVAKMQLLLAQT